MSRLRKEIEGLTVNKKKVRDYDPEDDHADDQSDDDSDEETVPGGREHYQKVGKSKLRKVHAVALDAKYGGVAVSRTAFDAGESEDEDEDEDPLAPQSDIEDGDDPFAAGGDESIGDSEDDDGEEPVGDRIRDDVRSRTVPNRGVEDGSEDETMESASDQDDLSAEEMDESSENSDEDMAAPGPSSRRNGLREDAAKSLASGLSQAASTDVKKGQAVKRQYQTFDRLLDARMKLQKGLTASDEFTANDFSSDAEQALHNAQQAAFSLFDSITSFRDSMSQHYTTTDESTSKKRKRQPNTIEDLDSTWQTLISLEAEAQEHRRKIISKWSNKVKASDPTHASTSKTKFLDSSSSSDNITAILDTYVRNEQEKHFRDSTSKHSLYEDTAFYQSLLRDLITSRAATSATADLPLTALPHKLHPSGNTQNKKTIDTKASKGRKIRYTVHEKLQNFMAAEGDTGRDTAMWTERGKIEFFASLFGQGGVLVEDEGSDGEDGDGDVQANAEGEALRLFRT